MVTNRYNKSTVKILKNLLKSLLNTFFGRDLSKHEVPVYEYNAILKRDVRVNIELRTDFILMSGVNLFYWDQLYEK